MNREAEGASRGRLVAIDVMRGIVMILMTLDHASEELNAGRVFTDSIFFWKPGTPLPAAQFLTRWITHLCAPTFVALAGASLAMSVASRKRRGEPARVTDRGILVRGLVIVALELGWMSWVMRSPGLFLCQVLWAIGTSLVVMSQARKLSPRVLLGLGLGIVFLAEVLVGLALSLHLEKNVVVGLLLTGGFFYGERLIVAYPTLSWLGMMMLGWAFGDWLDRASDRASDVERRAPKLLALVGVGSLVVFVVVRSVDGYGNMLLHRESLDVLQWLHVSKYPPSLTFATLELGIGALVLAALFAVFAPSRQTKLSRLTGVLRLYGQTALFYYVLHVHLLTLGAWALGLQHKQGLGAAFVGAAAVLAALFPACVWYRGYKTRHPRGWARFL